MEEDEMEKTQQREKMEPSQALLSEEEPDVICKGDSQESFQAWKRYDRQYASHS